MLKTMVERKDTEDQLLVKTHLQARIDALGRHLPLPLPNKMVS